MKPGKKRPSKLPDPLRLARELLGSGKYRDTRHALERQQERMIILPEVRQVIEAGWHERSRDEFRPEWKAWNYAIRGKTADKRELRIVVSFLEGDTLLVIVTAIDLSVKGDPGYET